MEVIRNTYPIWPNVAHAEPGDEVEWQVGGREMYLERASDGKTIFSRTCLPKDIIDYRPRVGIIAQVKSKGWVLEVAPNGGYRPADSPVCEHGKQMSEGCTEGECDRGRWVS